MNHELFNSFTSNPPKSIYYIIHSDSKDERKTESKKEWREPDSKPAPEQRNSGEHTEIKEENPDCKSTWKLPHCPSCGEHELKPTVLTNGQPRKQHSDKTRLIVVPTPPPVFSPFDKYFDEENNKKEYTFNFNFN